MKSFSKKSISLVLIFTILMAIFMPTMVSALSYDLTTGNVINSYNVTSDVVTLYIGNVSVDGTSTLKYLYTDKSVNTATLNEIDKILTGDYKTMLPTTAGQIKVSNDNTVTVNDVFTDAGLVAANKYPDGTVTDTSSTILYSTTDYNNLTYASSQEVSDEKVAELANYGAWTTRKTEWDAVQQAKADEDPSYNMHDFPEEYVKAFNDSTTYPTDGYFHADVKGEKGTSYIIRNSVMTQVDIYPINRTIIKVVNTSANVTTPTTTATKITGANVTLTAPKVGDKVEKVKKTLNGIEFDAQSVNPTVSTTTTGLSVNAYWVKGLEDLSEESFYGTFEEDTYYYAMIDFEAQEGYELTSTFPDGIKINGVAPDEVFAVMGGKWNHCIAKIKATAEETPTTYEYIDNTANQKYTINENDTLTFRINADYSLFENGGKVYVDDKLVSADNYTSKSGSTIITFTKDYMSSLSEGEHTLKVAFNNGGTAETKFTVAKASTTAEETTPTSTTETAKETTTSNNPKTGDNIITIFSIFAIATLGAFTTIKLNRNRKTRKH